MLVLSRELHESVMVGSGADLVCVTVVEIGRDYVKLGFEGRREVPINRQEVHLRIERDRAAKDAGVRAFGDGLA